MKLSLATLLASTTADQVIAATTMGVGIALVIVVRRILAVVARRSRSQAPAARIAGRVLTPLIVVVAAFTSMSQLGVDVGPLLGALGISGVVVALSLQPVLGNLVGSAMIHARRPIRPGDQIDSNGMTGTVLDISGRAVVLLTHDGTTVYIPNLKVLDEPLENFTRDPIRRTRLPIEVDYKTDLREAQRVIVEAAAKIEGVDRSLVAAPYRSFEDSGILIELRFWHPSEELEASWIVSEVVISVREALRTAGIEIAFPQRVLHLADSSEGNQEEEREPASSTEDHDS